ncbi:MAG: hypothetical protein OXF73_11015 [Gammaproteobacteria bacterium]|nr:hypothetical protein [Gammaproteobacteria bacterium]MCY4229016.1 hypothetical protein [Gammaproteobacteria bacterium]
MNHGLAGKITWFSALTMQHPDIPHPVTASIKLEEYKTRGFCIRGFAVIMPYPVKRYNLVARYLANEPMRSAQNPSPPSPFAKLEQGTDKNKEQTGIFQYLTSSKSRVFP